MLRSCFHRPLSVALAAAAATGAIADTRVVVCGDDGTLLAASLEQVMADPAYVWGPVERAASGALRGVAPSNSPEFAWAVGDDGAVRCSRDAGMQWPAWSSGTDVQLNAVVARGHLAVAVGDDGAVVLLDGLARSARPAGGFADADLHAVTLVGSGYVAVGDDGVIARSEDGIAWQRVGAGGDTDLHAVAFNDRRAVAVGDKGLVLVSDDGGRSWHSAGNLGDRRLSGVALRLDGLGVAVGEKGALAVTSDGGETWQTRGSIAGSDLNAVTFVGAAAFAAGDDGVLLMSRDNGVTWRSLPTGTDRDLHAIGAIWGVDGPEVTAAPPPVAEPAMSADAAPEVDVEVSPEPAPQPTKPVLRPSARPAAASASGIRSRVVLDGGVVEVRWNDGTVRRYEEDGAWTQSNQGGTTQRFAPAGEAAPLPGAALDGETRAWLEAHAARLVGIIDQLADNPDAVDHYMAVEGRRERSLPERVRLRTRYVERLAGL